MQKTRLGDVQIDLAEIDRLIEFGVIVVIAYIVSTGLRDSLLLAGVPIQQGVMGQWVAFFLVLLIYYGLVKVVLKINWSH
jgi:hypothetical protein